jgi:hypothetical protein
LIPDLDVRPCRERGVDRRRREGDSQSSLSHINVNLDTNTDGLSPHTEPHSQAQLQRSLRLWCQGPR